MNQNPDAGAGAVPNDVAAQKANYFALRAVPPGYYDKYQVPAWLREELPSDKAARILDIGCGYGQFLNRLVHTHGYTQAEGIDINDEAVASLQQMGIKVTQIEAIATFAAANQGQFQLITMSHVLEHVPKQDIIPTVAAIRSMLAPGGRFVVMVPNAQSATGTYWAYEDFTHTVMFTAGSLSYVLKAGGFAETTLLDRLCLAGLTGWKRFRNKFFTRLYEINWNFWNRVTHTSFHVPSPRVYSFEIKMRATK